MIDRDKQTEVMLFRFEQKLEEIKIAEHCKRISKQMIKEAEEYAAIQNQVKSKPKDIFNYKKGQRRINYPKAKKVSCQYDICED